MVMVIGFLMLAITNVVFVLRFLFLDKRLSSFKECIDRLKTDLSDMRNRFNNPIVGKLYLCEGGRHRWVNIYKAEITEKHIDYVKVGGEWFPESDFVWFDSVYKNDMEKVEARYK